MLLKRATLLLKAIEKSGHENIVIYLEGELLSRILTVSNACIVSVCPLTAVAPAARSKVFRVFDIVSFLILQGFLNEVFSIDVIEHLVGEVKQELVVVGVSLELLIDHKQAFVFVVPAQVVIHAHDSIGGITVEERFVQRGVQHEQ